MKWSGSPSRVEVSPGCGWYVYAVIVILLGSCLCLCGLVAMASINGSLS